MALAASSLLIGNNNPLAAGSLHATLDLTLPTIPGPLHKGLKHAHGRSSVASNDELPYCQISMSSAIGTRNRTSPPALSAQSPAQDTLGPTSGDSLSKSSISSLLNSTDVKTKSFSGYYPFRRTASRMTSATSMMDEVYLESLQRHYRLLMTHILLTDDVLQMMAEEKILPLTMIKDIREAETREEKNERLLNALRLRGNRSFKCFRELMFRTGNFFVADLLWEEGDTRGSLEEKDVAKFSGLLGFVQDKHKKRLLHFLDSKVRERALLMAWKTSPEERMEVLTNKAEDFGQEKMFRETIAQQEQKIRELKTAVNTREEEASRLRTELAAQRQQLALVKRDHRATLDTQARFHDANLSTITRLKDRLTTCQLSVARLSDLVRQRIDLGACDGDQPTMEDTDDLNMGILERNVLRVLQQFKREKELAGGLEEQRKDVLMLLNRRYSKQPLVEVVKDVLRHEQKHRSLVMRDIRRLGDTLRQVIPSNAVSSNPSTVRDTAPLDPSTLDTKHFKTELALLRAEAEHIQKRLVWKDAELSQQRQEMQILKQRLGAMPLPPTSSPLTTTTSASCLTSASASSLHSPGPPTTTPLITEDIFPPDCQSGIAMNQGHPFGRGSRPGNAATNITTITTNTVTPPHNHHPHSQRKNAPRSHSPSAKAVAFEDRTGQRSRGGKVSGISVGVGVKDRAGKRDLDQTLINADLYLMERDGVRERDGGKEEEGTEEDRLPAHSSAPSRGEGDITG